MIPAKQHRVAEVFELTQSLKREYPDRQLLLIHGCNTMNSMGKGLAKSIAAHWSLARTVERDTLKGDINKLGKYTLAVISPRLSIVNLYTQYGYGRGLQLDYEALEQGLILVCQELVYPDTLIVIPKQIGCGLAGGDLQKVEAIFERTLYNPKINTRPVVTFAN